MRTVDFEECTAYYWSVATDSVEPVPDDISDDDLQEVSRASLERNAVDHSFDGRPMDQHMATVSDLHLC